MPWESLRFQTPGLDRRVWYLLAAAVVAAAIGWSALSRLTPEEPTMPVTASVTTVPAAPTTSTTLPVVVAEADLRAIDPIRVERLAMAFAEVAAAEYFSGDAEGVWQEVVFDLARPTYVERVKAVEVHDSETGTMHVLVAVSVLEGDGEGGFARRPLRGVLIEVDTLSDPLQVVALPTPAELPFGVYRDLVVGEVPVDPAVAEAVRLWDPPFGAPEVESVTVAARPSGERVVGLVVVDEAGNRWPMTLALTEDGRIGG